MDIDLWFLCNGKNGVQLSSIPILKIVLVLDLSIFKKHWHRFNFFNIMQSPSWYFSLFSQEKALRKLHDIAFWGIELRILLREKNMQLTILYYMDLYKPYIPSPCNQNISLSSAAPEKYYHKKYDIPLNFRKTIQLYLLL